MTEQDLAEIIIGKDAEEFISSELGRVILGRAKLERQEALEELGRISWWRKRRVHELQNRVRCADWFQTWLYELITDGRAAEVRINEHE